MSSRLSRKMDVLASLVQKSEFGPLGYTLAVREVMKNAPECRVNYFSYHFIQAYLVPNLTPPVGVFEKVTCTNTSCNDPRAVPPLQYSGRGALIFLSLNGNISIDDACLLKQLAVYAFQVFVLFIALLVFM